MGYRTSDAEQFARHCWVVLVGVGKYRLLLPLDSPGPNVALLTSALQLPEGCAIPAEHVRSLINDEATPDSICAAVAEIKEQAADEDLIIMYFCGHGASDGREFFLCTRDANPQNLSGTALSGQMLDTVFSDAKANGVVIILDCCGSAGFASNAPQLFRTPLPGRFRILVSSSAPNESSWDLGKEGTLFTRFLLRVLTGDDAVGSSASGIIYLSDLMKHIQSRMSEASEVKYSGLTPQSPMVVGYQNTDPLLFVLRNLTMQQIAVKTIRYSREYINTVIKRVALYGIFVSLFLVGLAFAVSQQSEFLRTEQGKVVLYQGHPRIPLIIFPRPVWTFELDHESLRPSSPLLQERGTYVSDLGKGVLGKLASQVRPEYLWFVEGLQSDMQHAYELLRQQLRRGREIPTWAFGYASYLLRQQVRDDDMDMLRTMTVSTSSQLRSLGYAGLAQLQHFPTEPEMDSWVSQELGWTTHEDITQAIKPPCSDEKRRYLMSVVRHGFSSTGAVDAMLRLNCQFSSQELLEFKLMGRPASGSGPFGTGRQDDLTMFAAIQDLDGYRKVLLDFVRAAPDVPTDFRIVPALQSLVDLPGTNCDSSWTRFLQSPNLSVRGAALLLLGKYCGWRASQIEQYLPLSDLALVQVAELQIADVDYIKAKLDKTRVPFYVAYVLSAMRNIQDARVMDLALPYLTNGDRSLQAAAISVLRSKAYAGQAVMPLLDSPFEEVRYQAYLWLQTTNPKLARQYVIQRVGEMDPGSTLRVVNAKAPLAADEVRLLRGKLFGTEKEQAASACVLSAKLPPNQVIELLTSRFQSVRDGARSCLSLNDGAQQVFALAGKLEGFAAFDQLGLRELAETVRLGQQEVNKAPTWARTWRMRLFFATHRGLIGSPSAFASFDPELM